jgi:hypothetical protein
MLLQNARLDQRDRDIRIVLDNRAAVAGAPEPLQHIIVRGIFSGVPKEIDDESKEL